MLEELRVENLLLIEQAQLRFESGLIVLTGETGAGKTVLASALDLLLGGKPKSSYVRQTAKEAYVEGTFQVPAQIREQLPPEVVEYADLDQLVLARRVLAGGRTRAYIAGRSVTVSQLREISSLLLSFYGQHEHRKLALASTQLELLDSFQGSSQLKLLQNYREGYRQLQRLEGELEQLKQQDSSRTRELDILRYELDEIDSVSPQPEELDQLLTERDRLTNSDSLLQAAATAGLAIDEEQFGAISALTKATASLTDVEHNDSALAAQRERITGLIIELQDIASELTLYRQSIELDPARLEQVHERIQELQRLVRKHGQSVQDVIDYAQTARQRLDLLANFDQQLEQVESSFKQQHQRLEKLAKGLSENRKAVAKKLTDEVHLRLAQLAMEGASFAVELNQRPLGVTGIDQVEFMLAANPGIKSSPLRETASGGELSRAMLALLGAANDSNSSTLIFDEIDAGIGGRTANAVASQLRALAQQRQVICITHLPQIAAAANQHFRITKETVDGSTNTTVVGLGDGAVVDELVRMFGAEPDDQVAREHVKELIQTAR